MRQFLLTKKKFMIMAAAAASFLALVIVVVLAVWYYRKVEKLVITEPVYTYVGGNISLWPDGFTLRHEEDGMDIIVDKTTQRVTDVMFYYENRDAVILQDSMLWNQKAIAGQKRVDYFSEVRINGNVVEIESNGTVVRNPAGFLYNGSNTYLLLESATLTWESQSVSLGALSTVTAEYGGLLEVYDYETGTAFACDLTDSDLTIEFADGTQVLAATDRLRLTNGSWYLLITDPSVLDGIQ